MAFNRVQAEEIIHAAWEDRTLLKKDQTLQTINEIIEEIDNGRLRTAEPTSSGWKVNDWVKKAVILYFPTRKMEVIEVGPFEFYDKMALKKDYEAKGIRVVPHAVARYGALKEFGLFLMQ